MRRFAALLAVFAGIGATGCGASGTKPGQLCSSDADCAASDRCADGLCVLKNATSGGSGSSGSNGSNGGIQVSWSSPDAGFVRGAVSLAASASPASAVASLALSVDSTPLTTASAANAETTWDSTGTADGSHTLHALATGVQGGTAQADEVVVVDNTPPSVAWLAPDSGALVGNALSASVDARDDGGSGVAQVEVQLSDGGVLGSSAQAPYVVAADLTSFASGAISLDAVATDRAGNSRRATRTFMLDRPPAVSITSPDGGDVTGAFTADAQATDDLGVASVSFEVDGTVVGQGAAGTANAYTLALSTDNFALGAHTLTAIATDTSAQTAQASVPFTVVDQPPVVTFDSPAEGSSVSGASVSVAVHATDDVGVGSVTYSVNGGAASSLGGSSGTISVNGCVLGSAITIAVTATDSRGQTATSTLHLTNTSQPPVLTALAGQSSNDLAIQAQCGTPSGYTLYYSSQAGVTSSAQSHAVGSNGVYADSPLPVGQRVYYAAAADYGTDGQGPLSNEADAMPRALCPTGNWCVDDPPLGNFRINSIYEVSPTDVYAVGAESTVLHWDGTSWARESIPNTSEELIGVAASTSAAVAISAQHIYFRSSQSVWATAAAPADTYGSVTYDSRNFLVGGAGKVYTGGSGGASWSVDWTWSGGSPVFTRLAATSFFNLGSGINSYIAASDGNVVVYYRASNLGSGTSSQPLAVRSMAFAYGAMWQIASGNRYVDGVDAGPTRDDAYCSTADGSILVSHGPVVGPKPPTAPAAVNDSVYEIYSDGGSSEPLVTLSGQLGARVPVGETALGCSITDARVASAGGAIGVATGTRYVQDSPGVGARWNSLGFSADVTAVGFDGICGHFDADAGAWRADCARITDPGHRSNWNDLASGPADDLSVGDSWALGGSQFNATWQDNAAASKYASGWAGISAPGFIPQVLTNVAGIYYALGATGQFASYGGTSWAGLPALSNATSGVRGLAGRNGNDIWAIYGIGSLAQFTSVGWGTPSNLPSGDAQAIWAEPDGNRLWLTTPLTVNVWDGTSWTQLTSVPTGNYSAIGGSSKNDVWLAGTTCQSITCIGNNPPGLVAHFDGTNWTTMPTHVPFPRRIVSSPVWGQYLVDGTGGIWHRGR